MPLIYIVEDDANIREIEQFSLESAGYSTRVFTCAKDFYAALLEKAPALCLLDVMLPDEDGLTIVKKLRAGAATKHLPVLMVTAKSSELDKVTGVAGGADD